MTQGVVVKQSTAAKRVKMLQHLYCDERASMSASRDWGWDIPPSLSLIDAYSKTDSAHEKKNICFVKL